MKYYSTIIIDLNNIYWRSMCTCFKNNPTSYSKETIQDSLKRIREYKREYGKSDTKVYLCCDNPFSKITEREDLYPSYKHARKNKKLPETFYATLDTLLNVLKVYDSSYIITQKQKLEADDHVPIILRDKEVSKDRKVLLISNDMDWMRGLNDNIHCLNQSGIVFTVEIFKKKYKFSPTGTNIQMYKAIKGDTSDSIENAMPHLPSKILIDIVEKYNNPKEMLLGVTSDTSLSDKWKERFKENYNQIKLNFQLVDYLDVSEISLDEISIYCKEDTKQLEYLYKLYDLPLENRMLKESSNKVKYFKKPTPKIVRKKI